VRHNAPGGVQHPVDGTYPELLRVANGDEATIRAGRETESTQEGTEATELGISLTVVRARTCTVMVSRPTASASVSERDRQCENAAGRASTRGPRGDHESCQTEVDTPDPGSTRVMERYNDNREAKWHHDGVASSGLGQR
jgi:hypothetical protein